MFDTAMVFVNIFDILKNTSIVWGLISLHWAHTMWTTVYTTTCRTVRAAFEINMNQVWVFTGRNMNPWVLPEYKMGAQYPLVYYPSTSTFVFSNSVDTHNFATLVTAELKDSEGLVKHDMSTFFHSTKWISNQYAPSLYELCIVYFLMTDLLVMNEYIDSLTLCVMTSDGNEHKQPLSHIASHMNFTDWSVYDKEE